MPELPEVEVTRQAIAPLVVGSRLTEVIIQGSRTVRRGAWGPEEFAGLIDASVTAVDRVGKFLLLRFDSQEGDRRRFTVSIHLGMSGRLVVEEGTRHEGVPIHQHAVFTFDRTTLRFVDPRTFGEIFMSPTADDGTPRLLAHLGPDALGPVSHLVDAMEQGFSSSGQAIKSKLLDQRIVAGIGNIYSDEILFECQLHPATPVNVLTRHHVSRLATVTRSVLAKAVFAGGSSLKDKSFRDPVGMLGRYQDAHAVYGRSGAPCPRCGSSIRRVLIGGRSAHFCPRCQIDHSHGERRRPR
ncbi:MAG: bifunctional DNA-formamidopyrimidine glycosylase/DNA-(apurinic or apyrimidinic site) lyase [Acidimicrobiales bacterium]